ncbi:unnamed protein product [Schistocephalus solidus]|uniref:Uncharacterized protein n=1 Tax=Schistocephalus solidus TaxID=70667 RepID=A0A183SAA7_SCHSO|nr:unnamed protein product [Schistocephalus solidus]
MKRRQTDELDELVKQRIHLYASLTSTYDTLKYELSRLFTELEDLQCEFSSPISFGLFIDEAVDYIRTNNVKLTRVRAIRAEVSHFRAQWPPTLPASGSLPQTTTDNMDETMVLAQLADRALHLANRLDGDVSVVAPRSTEAADRNPDASGGLAVVRANQLREGCSARRSWFTHHLRLCRLLQTPFWQKGDWQSRGLGGLRYPSLSPLRPIVAGLRSGSRLAIKLRILELQVDSTDECCYLTSFQLNVLLRLVLKIYRFYVTEI